MTDLYNIVIKGRTAAGWENQEVKQNLAKIFNEPPDKMERLLSGKPVTVKKKVAHEKAVRIIEEIEKAGAECKIVKQKTRPSKKLVMEEKIKPGKPVVDKGADMISESRQATQTNPYKPPSSNLFEAKKNITGDTMKQRIHRIAPLQLGKLLAVIYALFSVVFIPFMMIPILMAPKGSGPGLLLALGIPILYIVIGFVGGIIGAFIYNLSAKWIGGIEIEIETI
ncbi:MAG: YIP1 family protein [Desulfobacteraceae bacterium]|nr:YIP1 family protein [Desulfobacteraceae bacterium]